MGDPTVCCVMLTKDRPELARRAVECFRAQTYPEALRLLFVFDTGNETKWSRDLWGKQNEGYFDAEPHRGKSIGDLRNLAPRCSSSDILIHWDDDDWSHPSRIAEQVELLQATGAALVGYDEMLFWRDHNCPGNQINGTGEAWLYRGAILGTSMCYWRETWERSPFRAGGQHNEDYGFALDVAAAGGKQVCVSAVPQSIEVAKRLAFPEGPRMIARIHTGNAANAAYNRSQMLAYPQHWSRVPQWDKYCASVME